MTTEKIAQIIIETLKNNGRVLIAGNGGSASQSQHFAGELVNKFFYSRAPLGALSLASDIAVITSIANDFSFDSIFSRQLEAQGREGDVLILLTTSGKSTNIQEAAKKAKELGIKTITFPTNSETKLTTPETQELHLKMIHEISGQVERAFYDI